MDELLSQAEINALFSGQPVQPAGETELSTEDSRVLDEVANVFAGAESSVMGMLAGRDVNVNVADSIATTQKEWRKRLIEQSFVMRACLDGLGDLPFALVVDKKGALILADIMMGGEGKDLPNSAGQLYLNAAQEGLTQIAVAALAGIGKLLKDKTVAPGKVVVSMEDDGWLPFPDLKDTDRVWASGANVVIDGTGAFLVWIAFPITAAKVMAGELGISQAVPSAEQMPAPQKTDEAEEPQRSASERQPEVHKAEFTPLPSAAAELGGSKLDLLADIPVRVTVELGKTRKNISEILEMAPGALITLDKMAGEPVDVLVNGKLIARGEVVVVDENFGVRITEILSVSNIKRGMTA